MTGSRLYAHLWELTPAERQVADLVAAGLTNRAIAKRRGVAVGTVTRLLTVVMQKLEVSSRRDVAAALAELGAGVEKAC